MQQHKAVLPLQLKSLKLSTFSQHWDDCQMSTNFASDDN
jgi:hypothetical protein